MRPTAGLVLGNRYRLVRQIAVGGMGEVWVAHDQSLARDVAAKVLKEEYAGNEDFLERLRTEARNAAGLSHENIAQLFDYGEQDGSGFLILELVVGEPMSDLLEREPVLPLRRLLPILSQAARGLHAAHVGGVVHRDVKPGNILLEHGVTVKITDFGVSLGANQVPMTAAGMVMGTAQYLSPEQAIGRAATGASDIYALGIVAYESLVGHRPFTGATAVDIAVAHVNEAVPPLPSTVHKGLAMLVMQMLEKDPEKRPRSAAALALRLDELARVSELDPLGHLTDRVARHGVSGGSVASTVSPSSASAGVPASTAAAADPAPAAVPSLGGTMPPSFAPRTRRELHARPSDPAPVVAEPAGPAASAAVPVVVPAAAATRAMLHRRPGPPAPRTAVELPSDVESGPVRTARGAAVTPDAGAAAATPVPPAPRPPRPTPPPPPVDVTTPPARGAHDGPAARATRQSGGWEPGATSIPARPGASPGWSPTAAASPASRRATSPPPVPAPPSVPRGTSGLRLGNLSWPLVGLLVLVAIIIVAALLGAAGPASAALLVPFVLPPSGLGAPSLRTDDKIAVVARAARDRRAVPPTTKDD
ncbi:serine/threonine protein kinase [Flavimobilis sp. GY10621]|uniref:non-specific serine/threonine protein kinase n=1 Tax=Flavimobilis rhizosphaerae TaxID=2775421 RepID=A0ABR9DQE2_9MICO|nr:serine/threonine-protein kinase [Flavimobilis rhizosphaerae]MBD9699363.1 serine/threonine protein kinase [Flavimobilis rhizosphaerae]